MKISFVELIKKIPRYTKYLINLIYYHARSLFYNEKDKYKGAWLFCERGLDAKDNAYWMFKYVIENHKDIKAYYVIDKNSSDYDRVAKIGPTINYNSFEHKMALVFAKYYVSTHIGFLTEPIWSYVLYKKLFDRKNKKKYIFLQHGITINDISQFYNKFVAQIDLFITATNEEYKSIFTYDYGYKKEEVKLTGFARFDKLYDPNVKKQVLFMPSWRSYILTPSYKKQHSKDEEKFENSLYFKKLDQLINSKELDTILKENDLEMLFYPHPEVQKYIDKFNISSRRIKIVDKNSYDIQKSLIESNILITDYSSVFFDFAYMKKPLIYYQFDQKEFFSRHYKKGYFDYERDGFGEVVTAQEEIIEELKKIIKNNYEMSSKYLKRVETTFEFTDNKNCERIFNEITKL